MARAEADGPLAEHLQAIGKDECIYDDRDVWAVLEAASLLVEMKGALGDLLDELADTGVDTTHHPAREYLTR